MKFLKMHGLGNDFVILDWRQADIAMPEDAARLIADRRRGVGCDQIMVLRPARADGDLYLEMFNADGSQAGACGNGTRCVADLVMREKSSETLAIETISGALACWRDGDNISVDMGVPHLDWQAVPLAQDVDTQAVHLGDDLPPAVCVSMGNPHAVLFYDDVSQVDIADLGSSLEVHPLFPERANIEFVSVISENHLRMRVWERGAGITDACGSGACATAVAAIKKGLTGAEMRITLDGGDLFLRWSQEGQHAGRVIMTGPVSYVADGRLHSELSDMLLR